jgi:hypothetical protein
MTRATTIAACIASAESQYLDITEEEKNVIITKH